MAEQMTLERATEFGESWNTGDPDLVASYFANDGVYHASVGTDHLGKSYEGRDSVRAGVQEFFQRFPGGKFENLIVSLFGDHGTFQWDFVFTDQDGNRIVTAGCDLLQFENDTIKVKNAFRKARPQ